MQARHSEPDNTPALPTFDRGMAALILGALLLIIAGLVAIPLAGSRAPALAPATTPEGVVQRFYQAAYAGDYSTAYGFLCADTQRRLSLIELQQQLSADLQRSQVRVNTTTLSEPHATVRVALTHFNPDGIFGTNEWQDQREVLMVREGGAWKIVSGPFYVPH